MQKEDRDRIQQCQIYLKIYLNSRQKDTIWRLNMGVLNNKQVVDQIKAEIQKYLEENDHDKTDPAIL